MPGDGGGGVSLPTVQALPAKIMGGVTGTITDPLGTLRGLGGGIAGMAENTPFDPGTWIDTLKGLGGGGGGKPSVDYGSNMATPSLSGYTPMSTLGGAGQLGASTVNASPWMQMALSKQAADQSKLLDNSMQNQASALAQGRSNLATKGGLSTGAAERMAMQGANDAAAARQNILNQGMSERANIGMQNANLQTDIGKFNATQNQNASQFNVSNAIQDLANKNEQNRFKYGEEMKLKGAAMSGQAIENSGKK